MALFRWYNVINKRKHKFHKWLSELISNLQFKSLNGEKIGRYKTHIKFLHHLDDNLLANKINNIRDTNVKSWILNHPTFILESQVYKDFNQLTARQAIASDAKIAGTLNGEKIYYRKDILQLKTKMGWHREMRKLKPNQRPFKTIEVKKVIHTIYIEIVTSILQQRTIRVCIQYSRIIQYRPNRT